MSAMDIIATITLLCTLGAMNVGIREFDANQAVII
jgi:hypothetical protein